MVVYLKSHFNIVVMLFVLFNAVKIDTDIWVLHAFQKKSKTGIKTPQMDIELIHNRLKRLKEVLKNG